MLTKFYLLHTNSSKFRALKKTRQAICFFYQLWTTRTLLNISLGPPNHNFQSFPEETHHKPKLRWRTLGFVIVLCEYGLLLKKPLSMNMRRVIWVMSFESLCELDPYVDVDDIIGYDPNWWKENMDHESASWSKDLTGHVSPIHAVEWNMSLFWALNRFTQKINNMLMWHWLPMK